MQYCLLFSLHSTRSFDTVYFLFTGFLLCSYSRFGLEHLRINGNNRLNALPVNQPRAPIIKLNRKVELDVHINEIGILVSVCE